MQVAKDFFNHQTIVYSTKSSHELIYHAYTPTGSKVELPVLVVVVGGFGFVEFQDRWLSPWIFEYALRKPSLVIALTYRTCPEVLVEAQIQDVYEGLSAVRRLLLNKNIGVKNNRFIVIANSYGGPLVFRALSDPAFKPLDPHISQVIFECASFGVDNQFWHSKIIETAHRRYANNREATDYINMFQEKRVEEVNGSLKINWDYLYALIVAKQLSASVIKPQGIRKTNVKILDLRVTLDDIVSDDVEHMRIICTRHDIDYTVRKFDGHRHGLRHVADEKIIGEVENFIQRNLNL